MHKTDPIGNHLKARYEAFWRNDVLDQPLVSIIAPAANAGNSLPEEQLPAMDPNAMLRYYTDPSRVLPRLRRQVARYHYAGAAFPQAFPVAPNLVALEAAFLGGHYTITTGTGWCEPSIQDWATRAPMTVQANNEWWQMSQRLLQEGPSQLADVAVLGIPDLQGGGQILDLLRGTERLALDLIEHPEEIVKAIEEINTAWFYYWRRCNDLLHSDQQGYLDWLGIWSAIPAVTVECDFSIMISADMFNEFFLPGVRWQTEQVERSIYHLDGEGSIRHLDALLSLDTLNGIQWVPVDANQTKLQWISLFKRIQDAGKLLVMGVAAHEVQPLLKALNPKGLLISTSCSSAQEAEALSAALV